jgi:hypothetical protein
MLPQEGKEPTTEKNRNYQAEAWLKEDMLEGLVGVASQSHELGQFEPTRVLC